MSRAGYTDDCYDPLAEGRWRAAVRSAMRGKRGQAFLKEALAALDAMPTKQLVRGALKVDGMDLDYDDPVIVGGDVLCDRTGTPIPMGSVCLLGAVGDARGLDMSDIDPHDMDTVAPTFGIADAMAREIVYWNDEGGAVTTARRRRLVGSVCASGSPIRSIRRPKSPSWSAWRSMPHQSYGLILRERQRHRWSKFAKRSGKGN